MSFQKVSPFVISLLTPTVIVLALVLYIQVSETRQMREDMKAFEQSVASLKLVSVEMWMDDEPHVSLQIPQETGMTSDSWWQMYPDTVRTITRKDYGAEWPFSTNDAILGCHGGEVLAVVNGGDLMVYSSSPSPHFFLDDIATISVFDPSSPELATARERMIDEAQGLCQGKVVR